MYPPPFDHERIYYRVVGDEKASGYSYSRGEAAIMATGEGVVIASQPLFEFDDLERVGRWLHLGTSIRRLRIPTEAQVVRSRPMSQGGCYTYRADRVELLEILPDYVALMQAYDATQTTAHILNFQGYTFPSNFQFPKRVRILTLQACLAVDTLHLPNGLERLSIFDSALRIGRVPPISGEISLWNSFFEGIAATVFMGTEVQIQGCSFL